MTGTTGLCPTPSPRSRVLGITAAVAVTLHAMLFFGFHWKTTPVAARSAPRHQGIAITLAPAPAPAPPSQAAQPPRPSPPPPVEEAPPPPPQPRAKAPKVRQRPRVTPRPAAVTTARSAPSAPAQTGETPRPALSREVAATVPTAAPEPVNPATNAKPVYPQLARKRGQEGRVLLRVQTDPQGSVMEIAVASGSGYPLLDEAALKAVRTWRFRPAMRGGQPVPGTVVIPVEFRLE